MLSICLLAAIVAFSGLWDFRLFESVRKLFTSLAVGGLLIFAVSADSLDNVATTKLKGYLGERLDAMIERQTMATDVDYLTLAFLEHTETNGGWQTEFWGKWMHAAVPYLERTGSRDLRETIERGVEAVLASQEPSGYIGNYPDAIRCGEGWDVWGMKYTMMGLLHFYDWTRTRSKVEVDKGDAALAACRRLCDYVIEEIGPNGKRGCELWKTGNWSGYASSSILEPVVWLYRRTNEKKYFDFASYIVKGMTEPRQGPRLLDFALNGVSVADRTGDLPAGTEEYGGYVLKHSRNKAYEMMSCYQGILEYVQVKNEEAGAGNFRGDPLFRATLATARDIIAEELTLAGGCACSERWFHGRTKQPQARYHLQETCVTTTWMRLCEKLLQLTDDPSWGDQIERSFYNAYLGALSRDGGKFAAYTPLNGSRWHGMHHCFMHTDCCSANGPRGFLCFLREFCRDDGKTLTFNFYGTAQVKGFDMYSLYPRSDAVRLVSHTEGSMKLRLRIPVWSAKSEVRVNGKELPTPQAGSYCVVSRKWKLGDVVELKLDMPVVAHRIGAFVAYTRGPILLARDSRFGDGDLMEPRWGDDEMWKMPEDGAIMKTFVPVCIPTDDMWMAFSAVLPLGTHSENPEGGNPVAVGFCDFASAGNVWSRKNYYRTWFPVETGPWGK